MASHALATASVCALATLRESQKNAIDGFKSVNDNHGGHATGNEALRSIAETAASCVRGKGSAYRLHGDEFVLLLQNHTLHETLAVAERFRREINASPRTSRQLTLSVSVGVATWPTHGNDLDALLKAADDALLMPRTAAGISFATSASLSRARQAPVSLKESSPNAECCRPKSS